MLILAKAALAMMLGFIIAIVVGLIVIPVMKSLKLGQKVSLTLGERHLSKDGTPTLGGLIFIIPMIITLLLLWFKGSISLTYNLVIVIFVFLAYALLGFVDDFLKIYYKNNKGLSILFKLVVQTIIALVFFYIFIRNGGSPVLSISALNLRIDLGWTDGLDGLAGGLSAIAFLAYGLITWNTTWLAGYQEIAIFCFVLVGALLGFLLYNSHPAKIFMGDTGSLALGGSLAAIAILTRHELSLAVIGGVFVVEALSSLIQIFAIRKFHKKIFLMAPIHHHFEKLGWAERDIVKLFWVIGLLLSMIMITYNVWL